MYSCEFVELFCHLLVRFPLEYLLSSFQRDKSSLAPHCPDQVLPITSLVLLFLKIL